MPQLTNNKAVLILESQPPHLGEMLQIVQALKTYNFLYLCINPTPLALPFEHVFSIWRTLLGPYSKRVEIVTTELNMVEAHREDLPPVFKDCMFLTTDNATFIHLNSLGIAVQLVSKALGYYGVFIRSAYRQSRALSWLESKFTPPARK